MFNRRMNRREFLRFSKRAACVACSAAAFGSLGNNLVLAQTLQGTGRALVLVNLFGGIDGLNWIVPYSRSVYYDRRPTIAVPANVVLPLNNEVGLHPSWSALHAGVHQAGQLAVVQQVGYPDANHSHFESQDIWSFGRRVESRGDERGWIGRLADQYFDSNFDVIGVGVSQRIDFQSLRADARPVVVNTLQEFGFQTDYLSGPDNAFRSQVAELNAFADPPASGLRGRVQETSKKIYSVAQQLRQIDQDYHGSATYPGIPLGTSLHEIAKLIQSQIGTQVFYTGIGGWDTHSDESEALAGNLGGVAAAVNAFVQDVRAMGKWDDVCIVFFSEFGRNCYENGSGGTDHGHGNNMVLMGGRVRGGVYGPTPSNTDLRGEDVGYAIDFRSVFKTAIRQHLGLDPDPVFDEPVPIVQPYLPLFI
ncbi:MAG: DUF1501 domain-containing protein [Bdellovibrionota bacterium]